MYKYKLNESFIVHILLPHLMRAVRVSMQQNTPNCKSPPTVRTLSAGFYVVVFNLCIAIQSGKAANQIQ